MPGLSTRPPWGVLPELPTAKSKQACIRLAHRGKGSLNMASKWQQWMPFHIDRFRGSPSVQAMHPAARMGYLYLLATAWQTEDCTIPTDPLELAEKSGMGDEFWALHGPRILRNFIPVELSRLRNEVCFREWSEAKRVFEARRDAAMNTTKTRNPRRKTTVTVDKSNGDRHGELSGATRPADTITGTVTSTEEQKQNPSRGKPRAKDPNCKTALRKKKHGEFKDAIKAYWIHTNGDLEMPWAEAEGMQLDLWLKASPNATLQDFRRMLYNRSLSQVNQTERPSKWIRNVTDFWKPVDRFNKPPERANSNGKGHSNLAALNESLAEDGYHASYQDGPDGDGDPALNDGGQLDLKTLLAQVGEGKA